MSRAISPKTEIPWILAGAVIPDIPWIFQRLMLAANIIDPYQVRLYFTVQASLFFGLLLSFAVAAFAKRPKMIFILLAGNCFIHLLLDALQRKWGNGVHLLAPFSWQTTSLGIIWPEHILGYAASLAGVIYLAFQWKNIKQEGLGLGRRPPWFGLLCCVMLYVMLPLVFMADLEKSNANYIRTLHNSEQRPGTAIEIDRSYFSKRESSIFLFTGEPIKVSGTLPEESGLVSLTGKFTSADSIHSDKYHSHNGYRDYASRIGLGATFLIWSYLLFSKFKEFSRRGKS